MSNDHELALPTQPSRPSLVDASASGAETLAIDPGLADSIIRVEEVADAEFYVGALFRDRFRGDPPDYPRHFVALYKATPNCFLTLGFIHYTVFEDVCLCGGLIEDRRVLMRMPAAEQNRIKAAGGVVAVMFHQTLPRMRHLPAVWAQAGESDVREWFLGVGFAPVDGSFILVKWNRDLPASEREQRIARVKALGPF